MTGSISLDHQEFNAQGLKKVLHESANTKPALLDNFINLCAFAVPASGMYQADSGHQTMNRNVLYLVIGALAVAAVMTGYLLYQEQQKTSGIELNLDKNGVSIETK